MNLVGPEDRETFKKAAIDQFLAHVAETQQKMTGEPLCPLDRQTMVVLATILSTTGQGTLATEGPDHAARAMIGACEIIREAWGE